MPRPLRFLAHLRELTSDLRLSAWQPKKPNGTQSFTTLEPSFDSKHLQRLDVIWSFPKIGGPPYRPQYIMVLIIGTPKMVPLILGNSHITFCTAGSPHIKVFWVCKATTVNPSVHKCPKPWWIEKILHHFVSSMYGNCHCWGCIGCCKISSIHSTTVPRAESECRRSL